MDPNSFIKTQPKPASFDKSKAEVETFLQYWSNTKKKLVLITSGGTSVPLEKRTVRSVDNFSVGTRGAKSVEYFLENGYLVIFLHRQFSLLPYSRHFSHSNSCFLDYLTLNNSTDQLEVDSTRGAHIVKAFKKYQEVKKSGTYLPISFVTITEYLFLLTAFTQLLAPLKSRAMIYLAAAVSDFYVPEKQMIEHKIQSSNSGLNITMVPVPKFVAPIVSKWAPDAYIITFKLETDRGLLALKAQKALKDYGHQLVIANLLTTRSREVWLHFPGNKADHYEIFEGADNMDVESLFIPETIRLHNEFIQSSL